MNTSLIVNVVALLISFFMSCRIQFKATSSEFHQISIQFYADPDINKFVRSVKETSIIFGEEIKDSIDVYHNNQKSPIFSINGYQEVDDRPNYQSNIFRIIPRHKKNSLTVVIVNQKKYFSFNLDKRFPVYTVNKIDSVWIVNARLGITVK